MNSPHEDKEFEYSVKNKQPDSEKDYIFLKQSTNEKRLNHVFPNKAKKVDV